MSIKSALRNGIKRIPILGDVARALYQSLQKEPPREPFPGSANYWERRYATGGNSGVGSYDKFAEFKAEVLNAFVADNDVDTVIEFGCGDGNQLSLARYPRYLGFDVSPTVIDTCNRLFANDTSKSFKLMHDYDGEQATLTLSLDVIYHLVEDEVFEQYMRALFGASTCYVIVYASNTDDNEGYAATHVWHRRFTDWIDGELPGWKLVEHIPNRYPYKGDYTTGSFADFYVYARADGVARTANTDSCV